MLLQDPCGLSVHPNTDRDIAITPFYVGTDLEEADVIE